MDSIIFDTSVWIDFSRKNENQNSLLLKNYLENDREIYLCPPIYQEILQGSKHPEKTIDLLDSMNFLNLDPYFAAKEAALMYQKLRKNGITIRKPNDCLIAFYAIHFDIALAHNDADFDNISQIFSIKKI
jgi:predicted nucleic acid-binding protein